METGAGMLGGEQVSGMDVKGDETVEKGAEEEDWQERADTRHFSRRVGDRAAWVVELEFEGSWRTWHWQTFHRKGDGQWQVLAVGYATSSQQAREAADRSMYPVRAIVTESEVAVRRIAKWSGARKR